MENEWSDGDTSDDDSDDSSNYDKTKCTRKYDEEYYMLHPRRGRGLIFNFMEFDKKSYNTRHGSAKDAETLKQTLKYLGFEVKTYTNLTADATRKALDVVAREDHSDADCLCVCVMTHGHEGGRLAARDVSFEVSDLWGPFTSDKCKSLAGKPKLFFVQACRGSRHDIGSNVAKDLRDSTISYRIPVHSDILLAYSSVHGFSSIRDVKKGSWFIQSLSEELKENGKKDHLLTILTFVCQRVAIDFETFNGEKQMPTIVSMLTRLLYFRPLEDNDYRETEEEAQEMFKHDSDMNIGPEF